MNVLPVVYQQFYSPSKAYPKQLISTEPSKLIDAFCKNFKLPNEEVNHALFDEDLAQKIAMQKENAIKPILKMFNEKKDEESITAGLFLLNRIIDEGVKNVGDTYPVISRFNYHPSHNVQVMLAGIYRKTLVPDGFGPLVTMFLKNAHTPIQIPFDPNEEIGGAILEYLRNTSAQYAYKPKTN